MCDWALDVCWVGVTDLVMVTVLCCGHARVAVGVPTVGQRAEEVVDDDGLSAMQLVVVV
jgi:hypothetical protein